MGNIRPDVLHKLYADKTNELHKVELELTRTHAQLANLQRAKALVLAELDKIRALMEE